MTHYRTHLAVLFVTAGLVGGSAAGAADHAGTDTVTLSRALGLQETGAPAPAQDAACKAKFGKYLGEKVTTEYKIDPQTSIMSASSTFKSVPTKLFPLGISGAYYFMSDGVPPPLKDLGVMRIIFNVDKTFKNPTSKLMFPLGVEKYNCLLTSSVISDGDKEALTKASSQK
jgi:hypothetical protein